MRLLAPFHDVRICLKICSADVNTFWKGAIQFFFKVGFFLDVEQVGEGLVGSCTAS